MKRINQFLLPLASLFFLQAGCSKQEPAPKIASTTPMAIPASKQGTATATAGTEPIPMDMQMGKNGKGESAKTGIHHATGVVKAMDAGQGTVTLAHGPVATLHWPAITMTFKVRDKSLLNKLESDRKVDVDFMQENSDYIITSVK